MEIIQLKIIVIVRCHTQWLKKQRIFQNCMTLKMKLIKGQLITAYEVFENVHKDSDVYQEAQRELDNSYFKFQSDIGLKKVYPDIFCTFAEKKEKTKALYQKIDEIKNNYNSAVTLAYDLSITCKELKLPFVSYEEHVQITTYNKMKNQKLDYIGLHISNKSSGSESTKLYPKIKWGKADVNKRKSLITKLSSAIKISSQEEDIASQQSYTNNWVQRKFKAYHRCLKIMKSKIDCEKKFIEIRFSMMCLELNSFKRFLNEELTCIDMVTQLENNLVESKNELKMIEDEISSLKEAYKSEKSKLVKLSNTAMQTLGKNDESKSYYKNISMTSSDIHSDQDSSGKSSETAISIDNGDDSQHIMLPDADGELSKEKISLHTPREEIEMKMKTYKREIRTAVVKRSMLIRKIQKLNDSVSDLHVKLNEILISREKDAESFNWPLVLYAENLHADYVHHKPYSIAEKLANDKEMSNISNIISNKLAITNNLAHVSVFLVLHKVVTSEINDMIDAIAVLNSILFNLSTSLDDHSESIKPIEASETTEAEETESKEYFNTTRNVFRSVSAPADLRSEHLLCTKDPQPNVDDMKKQSLPESLSSSSSEEFDLSEFKEALRRTEKEDQQINLGKDCIRVKPICLNDDIKCDRLVSTAIAPVNFSELTDNFPPLSGLDYYMSPFKYELSEEDNLLDAKQVYSSSDDLIYKIVLEVMEYIIAKVEEEVKQEEEEKIEREFPIYPGGGLVLTLSVLQDMEKEDEGLYSYTSFYQDSTAEEDLAVKYVAKHIIPNRKFIAPFDFVFKDNEDFIIVDSEEINKMLESYHGMKAYTKKLQPQIRSLKKTMIDTKKKVHSTQERFVREQQSLNNQMLFKFSRIMDLESLQDQIDCPQCLIRRQEIEEELEVLHKNVEKLKADETRVLKSYNELRFQDTKVCYELLELRQVFNGLNKKFSYKRTVLPKIGSVKKIGGGDIDEFETQ